MDMIGHKTLEEFRYFCRKAGHTPVAVEVNKYRQGLRMTITLEVVCTCGEVVHAVRIPLRSLFSLSKGALARYEI